ncbi:phage tail tip fiber protein [Yersinia rochesterensis]|uniref:phage tail tip fiber protein n=1 Tax=Yersinia rochesterensis TaxID=1604335 RepID=UPI001F1A0172|nr:DUF1983 domain-containing protein [Yersinia rochesterensis]
MSEAEQIAYIKAHLSDVWWRLNNLYKIVNEDGELVTFRMRPAQRELFKNMHYRNIILKARQLGFSTGIDIYLLDQALFNKNLSCGIIAQDLPAAGEIFSTKISVPFDNLPPWLRATFPVSTRREGANGGHIEFAHGSKIRVSTSFRSGTVQRLHISEHGKICAKYPAKAKEVRTGTLNAIKDGCIVFIESTAEGVGGDFHTMSTRAMDLGQLNLPLTSQDYKFHFFAWWQDPKYQTSVPTGGLRLSKYHQAYFAAVEQAMGITLLDEQKQWYKGTPAKTAVDIDELIDLINKEINDSPLIGELANSVGDLDKNGGQAFQKMWSTKVNASGITAGIGIVAGKDASGKPISQVAISASQFFVFDPNNPTDTGTYAIPFSVVGGKVVITEAVIREATIKILNAQTIIADEVKAGISISTPTLKSATINNGKFTVDAAGNLKIGDLFSVSNTGRITIRQGAGSIGLVITNDRIEVYDEKGALMVRLGKLD